MRLNINKAGCIYFCVVCIFFLLAIKGMKNGKLFGVDNYIFMGYIVLTRIVYLLIHELSHVFALLCMHLKIREFKIYGFRYEGVTHKWKFSMKEFAFSGYVIPWLTYDIDTDETYNKFKTAYILSLFAGPILPFFICFFVSLVGKIFSLPLGLFVLTFFINAVLMLLSSFIGNQKTMGDIQSIIYFSKDANFSLQLREDLNLLKENVSERERNYLDTKNDYKHCTLF